ncbi:unnamed protein product, partial [Polarella glacialis]
ARQTTMRPCVIAHNAAIAACATPSAEHIPGHRGQGSLPLWKLAVATLAEMVFQLVQPDAISFGMAAAACVAGAWAMTSALLAAMPLRNIAPDHLGRKCGARAAGFGRTWQVVAGLLDRSRCAANQTPHSGDSQEVWTAAVWACE